MDKTAREIGEKMQALTLAKSVMKNIMYTCPCVHAGITPSLI